MLMQLHVCCMFYVDTGFALKHLADFMSLELILRDKEANTSPVDGQCAEVAYVFVRMRVCHTL